MNASRGLDGRSAAIYRGRGDEDCGDRFGYRSDTSGVSGCDAARRHGLPEVHGRRCGGLLFTNSKVIVARSYVRQIAPGSDPPTRRRIRARTIFHRDRDGHGTAVASAAAAVPVAATATAQVAER